MSKQQNTLPDFGVSYREAGQILGVGGNRLLLIEAILLTLLTVPLYVFLSDAYTILCGYWLYGPDLWLSAVLSLLFALVLLLLTLFFTLPLVIGLLALAGRMERGEGVIMADLFVSFSTAGTYRRALALSWGFLWRLVLVALTVWLTCSATATFFGGSLLAGLLCGVAVVIELVVGLRLCGRCFATLFVTTVHGELSVRAARAHAKRIRRLCRYGDASFMLHMLPRLLLGLLTLGILLLWETLPRMAVAYFRYCRYMNEMIIRSEEL